MKNSDGFNMRQFYVRYLLGMIVFATFVSVFMKYKQYDVWFHKDSWIPFVAIFVMSTSIGFITMYMMRKAATMRHQKLTKRIVPGVIIFYISSYIIANLSITLSTVAAYLVKGRAFDNFWHNLLTYELSFGNKRLFGWLVFFTVVFFYSLWRKSANREQKLIEENLRFQYNTLKAQVNPHFLFNSLNVLSELVHIDANKADRFIQKLSKVYRYVIENETVDLVPLEDEMKFVNHFYELQQDRSDGKIQLNVTQNYVRGLKVIPVSVQLLVENAIKHNLHTSATPLVIDISIKADAVTVSNSIQRKNTLPEGTKSGLSNLKDRVKIIMDKELVVREENDCFEVSIPLKAC